VPCAYARFEKRAEKRKEAAATEEYRAMVVVYIEVYWPPVLKRVVRHSAVYSLCP
jgi:hypothetical protein